MRFRPANGSHEGHENTSLVGTKHTKKKNRYFSFVSFRAVFRRRFRAFRGIVVVSRGRYAEGKRCPTKRSYIQPPITAPRHGATIGTHHHPLPARNTSPPQPATNV